MICISLCDDDATLMKELRYNLSLLQFDIEVFSYQSGEELLNSQFLNNDIIILDIEMDGINGIETAHKLRTDGYDGIIIFTTSHKEMVFDSFQVKPYHYIVKPVITTVFNDILEKAIRELLDKRNNYFEAVSNSRTYRIPLSDIYYFESQGRKIDIFLKDEMINITGKMHAIENELKRKYFFRCHKGYLINLQHVYGFSENEITLENKERIPVSRLKLHSFKEAFKAFMKGNKKC